MAKNKSAKCPHPNCVDGFVYEAPHNNANAQPKERAQMHGAVFAMMRLPCPICQGEGHIRKRRG